MNFQNLVGQCLLGIDLGKKKIGLAISNESWSLCLPLETYRRTKFTEDIQYLDQIISTRNIGGIVIGLPLLEDGTEGPMCQSVRQFIRNWTKSGLEIPVLFHDERLTSVEAYGKLHHVKKDKPLDAIAAQIILESATSGLQK